MVCCFNLEKVYLQKILNFSGKIANRLSKNPRRSILGTEKSNDADKTLTENEKSLNGKIKLFMQASNY